MKFRELRLVCECGHVPARFRTVGFTAQYELVIHWWCMACGKLAYVVKPLADCCRECPDPEESSHTPVLATCNGAPESRRDSQSEDARFLRSLGIAVES